MCREEGLGEAGCTPPSLGLGSRSVRNDAVLFGGGAFLMRWVVREHYVVCGSCRVVWGGRMVAAVFSLPALNHCRRVETKL